MKVYAFVFSLLLSVVCSKCRPVILYLAQFEPETSNHDLEKSLEALHHVFSSKHPEYPVVITYDDREADFLTPEKTFRFSSALQALPVPCEVVHDFSGQARMCFAGVKDFGHVPWPFSLYKFDYKESDPYYSRLGYRNMCRFWIKTLFQQPFMANVSTYFRLDTDTILQEMPDNPFQMLEDHGLGYLGSVMYLESSRQVEGLWETFLRYSSSSGIHPGGLAPLSNAHTDKYSEGDIQAMSLTKALKVLRKRGYNLKYFYNNWEVSRVDLWSTPAYLELANEIDKAGGIFMRRWGDAPVRTLSLFFLRDYFFKQLPGYSPIMFEQYKGLKYFHKAVHATPPKLKEPVFNWNEKLIYVYDRPVCTGLGDRVGTLMTLATLASLHDVQIAFEWCPDPSVVFSRIHKHIPQWEGYDYDLPDFIGRFWPHHDKLTIITNNFTSNQKQSNHKIVWENLAVPAEAGLDIVYTTAWKATQVPGKPVPDAVTYKSHYRSIALAVKRHALAYNHGDLELTELGYIVLHMRGPDNNNYQPFEGAHDPLSERYCTRKVVKKLLKGAPLAHFRVVTNNADWLKKHLQHPRLQIVENATAYNDFALLLGAKAIVQHAMYGWSSFSSVPAMIQQIPLITTFKRHLQHHRLGWFDNYGGIPDEFHDCGQISEFIKKVVMKFKY